MKECGREINTNWKLFCKTNTFEALLGFFFVFFFGTVAMGKEYKRSQDR